MTVFYPYYCGDFQEGALPLDVINPYNQSRVGSTYLLDLPQMDKAIEYAYQAVGRAAELSSFQKSEALLQIAEELNRQQEEFAFLICQESGKPLKLAYAEVERAIQTFRIAAEESKRLPAEYISLDWTPQGKGKEGWINYFPIGVVAGISPFNFPLNLAVHKIAPAIASGCPIVLKPSSLTPLSVLALARIIHETRLPSGMVSVVPSDRMTGNLLVSDSRIALLSFTGSPSVGWNMKSNAGRKRVVLELGGNAGMVVTPTADILMAVKKAVAGAFSYAGQVCIHTQRIYVHESVMGAFRTAFLEGVLNLRSGDPMDPKTDISVMIDEDNALRVESWVNEALEAGAVLLAGGKRNGRFFSPTVLSSTQPGMKVCSEEIFGPVVTLETYYTFEEVVNEINNTKYGLQAGVFTHDLREMDYAFRCLKVGGVILNDTPTFRVDHMPYGGVKDSGFGREGVRYAMMDMLDSRILVKDKCSSCI